MFQNKGLMVLLFIHAFGKGSHNGIPGILHAVVRYDTASKCMEYNVLPDNSSTVILSKLEMPIVIKDINGKLVKMNCCIDTYLMDISMETTNI